MKEGNNMPKSNETLTATDTEALTAALAWEYNEKVRQRIPVSLNQYLDKLPDATAREQFKEVVEMSGFLDAAVTFQATYPNEQETDASQEAKRLPAPSCVSAHDAPSHR